MVNTQHTVSLNVSLKSIVNLSDWSMYVPNSSFFLLFFFFYVMTEAKLIPIHNVVLSCVSVFG